MSSPNHRADVIDLNAARRERNRRNRVPNQQVPAPRRGSDAQTVIINAVLKGGHEEVHRHIGINDSVPLEELRHALQTMDPEAFLVVQEGVHIHGNYKRDI